MLQKLWECGLGVADNSNPWAKPSSPSVLANQVLLESRLAHLYRLSCSYGRKEWPQILTLWTFRESFPVVDTDPRYKGDGGIWASSPAEAIPELRHKG